MKAISKEDFATWKQDKVTEAFFELCAERIQDLKDILADTAGIDPVNDNHNRGFIKAYEEGLKVDFE